MAGIAATSVIGGVAPVAALKLSSTIMYLSAIGMLSIMNKIQPSQLAEEQRNATRLLKQLHNQIQTIIAMGLAASSSWCNAREIPGECRARSVVAGAASKID
ncbi:probable F-box At4g22030 [Olea europaea subsp. europaea]|uniref:Probable F-box At4g22030 n=1 Tax=Olea europaea subsp. europaea TaxID=158383 RepID=A0A8S0R269_OLEEU|nr:probable F-box At4g22030 [Olea europaea subsp. europaea]